MCWYSAEYLKEVLQAEAGQRLVLRRMYNHANWAVRECDLTAERPVPVCLRCGARLVLRPSEQQTFVDQIPPDGEVVFRMLENPKRDVFEFPNGRQIEVDTLPSGLVFDVLATCDIDAPSETTQASKRPKPSILKRLRSIFAPVSTAEPAAPQTHEDEEVLQLTRRSE